MIELTIDDWKQPTDNDASYLIATIMINGCPVYLEAHAVKDAEDLQCNDNRGEECGSSFEELNAAFQVGGRQESIAIGGRDYVLFARGGG